MTTTNKTDAFLGWAGSLTGLFGAALLATNSMVSPYGWLAFLVSNAAWIAFATRTRTLSLLTMQIGFTGTSLLGIYRWLI